MSVQAKVVAVVVLGMLVGLGAAETRHNSDEQTIRKMDAEWSQAAGSKNLERAVSYYAADASLMPFNAPIATGLEQIRKVWSGLMAKPGFKLSFAPTKIAVSKSGDMAYEIGTFRLTMNDAQGKPATTPGKYVVVWRKRGGTWKAVADIFNTDK